MRPITRTGLPEGVPSPVEGQSLRVPSTRFPGYPAALDGELQLLGCVAHLDAALFRREIHEVALGR